MGSAYHELVIYFYTQMTLSVDIGYNYLAYAHYENEKLKYGIWKFKTTDKPKCCAEFLSSFKFTKLIIEKQISTNYICIANQHYLEGAAATYPDVEVEIQDARKKFKKLGVVYDTQNKAHKALSVDLALKYLDSGVNDDSEKKLSEYSKQDDIADAINMLRDS
jgi:hypothetical protein